MILLSLLAPNKRCMIIAQQKRKENIAEYLLYMWQVEDLIRANHFDIDLIEKNIIEGFDQPESVRREMKEWYEHLIAMMLDEGVKEKGHIQINKNVLIDLNDLHNRLLRMPKEAVYGSKFYQTLPFIIELRGKSGLQEEQNDIELCFNALYGYMLLRLQRKEVSQETIAAMKQISTFLALLAQKYKQVQTNELSLDEE